MGISLSVMANSCCLNAAACLCFCQQNNKSPKSTVYSWENKSAARERESRARGVDSLNLLISVIQIQINKGYIILMSSFVSRTGKHVRQSLKSMSSQGGFTIQSETGMPQWAWTFCRVYESTPFRVHWFQGDTISLQSRTRIFTYSSKNSVEFYSFLY